MDTKIKEYLSKIGSIKTEKKAKSSRENGKKGGRPKVPANSAPLTTK